jgi:KDO2-lipid IV(A) lauroyltransferase
VVYSNIRYAFPAKPEKEIKQIANRFYRNLSDLIVEVIKLKSIDFDCLRKRIHFNNYDLLDDLYQKKKSIVVTIGHCGNWEWMTMVLDKISPYMVFAIVKPLNSAYFEEYFRKLRTRFNAKGGILPFKTAFRTMVRHRNELTLNIVAGDQTPTKDEINYVITFLNRPTPVFLGIEKIARSLDYAVVFFDIQRKKRGYYDVNISLIEEFPKRTSEHEITGKHVKKLEQVLNEHPDNWLWSHRRWKHTTD